MEEAVKLRLTEGELHCQDPPWLGLPWLNGSGWELVGERTHPRSATEAREADGFYPDGAEGGGLRDVEDK
jgi:hypothetical protein